MLRADEPPKDLDFIGGYFEDGIYTCYQEPCFQVHKTAYPAANNIAFNTDQWPHWLDIDQNCQKDNVQAIAMASQTAIRFQNDDECGDIIEGSWSDQYSGRTTSSVNEVVTDYLISLEEAHTYGALAWPTEKRTIFANTTANQVVVTDAYKKARNGASAANWMPPNEAYWCRYIVTRERIARKFNLRFPNSEKKFNQQIKNLYCKY